MLWEFVNEKHLESEAGGVKLVSVTSWQQGIELVIWKRPDCVTDEMGYY